MKKLLLLISGILVSGTIIAQGTVTGRVLDGDSGEPLPGVNAMIDGTTIGSISDLEGLFTISNTPAGGQTLVLSYVGYETVTQRINVAGQTLNIGTVMMNLGAVGLKEVEVIASLAIDRQTPVAVSTIRGQALAERIGNQEFPEIMKTTPSVYVTKEGGGFGDSRINIRGFDQSNTAVMINGVPVNDMENGWVYWSNWAGLSDVTSSIQVQRGLSASKLAISSVGGTVNIITNAAEMQKGGKFNVDIGNDGYQKYGLVLSTGLGENGWAMTVQGTHTRGNGYVDGTKFSAYSYFLSVAKKINNQHTISFTGLGAPQWHHQRTIGFFDGISFQVIEDHPRGIRYNSMWGELDGEEFNWRRNFYHKPKFFLNHYWTVSEKTNLNTTAYVSFGRGGGTGPRGRINGSFENSTRFYDDRYGDNYQGQVRFDDIAKWNQGQSVPDFGADKQTWFEHNPDSIDNRRGFFDDKYVSDANYGFIYRASMNSHNWYGILSTLEHELSSKFNLIAGFDGRYYKGIHYRRVTDLLGSAAYFENDDINMAGTFFNQEKPATAIVEMTNDQQIDYFNDGIVGWLGLFAQLEYVADKLSAHLTLSGSNQSYKRVDYFNYYYSDELSEAAGLDERMESSTESQLGGNIKAGVNYNINSKHNVYFNTGYYGRQPLFDAVFLNFVNKVNPDYKNEKVFGLELGYGFRSRYLNANLNLYQTTWTDRFRQEGVDLTSGEEGTANLSGIGQKHQGIEIEVFGEIFKGMRLDAMVSLGNWVYSDDITTAVFDDDQNNIGSYTLYLNNVKVGDAAQTTARLGLTYTLLRGLRIYGSYYYADQLYASFSPVDTGFAVEDNLGALELPSYSLIDLGAFYNFKLGSLDMTARVNVNNVSNTKYIAESESNNHPESGETLKEVNFGYYGFGTTWNAGLGIRF
ncbi:MAG: TonB-dependent receptor [Cyclobacteriaceae bacterium]|nr:TonB-dependent receptor [Cyclobacteriaceae bacterium]